jgi:4-hydroxy-2-oxoheptanedioate aldolase
LGAIDYLKQANEAILTIVQIETKEALENVDAIAAVPGIDVLFVGPFDLGNNIGHPILDFTMHENLVTAIDKVLQAANSAGKKAGIFCTNGQQGKAFADKGFHMISVATDIYVLAGGVSTAIATAKESRSAPKQQGYGS